MTRTARIAATAGVALTLAIALWPKGRDSGAPPLMDGGASPHPTRADEPAAAPTPRVPGGLTGSESITPARPALPTSLRDTDVDGGFSVGPAGHLAPNPDALALFDYFLAASGEEPLPQIVERIIAEIRQRLTDPAASEAIALLDQYLAYRTEIRELTSHSEPPHDLERRLQWLRELRNQHFGANTAAQLFGEQEAITLVDLERRRVAADPSLSDAERDQRLAALDDRLPPRVAEARHNARAPARAQREVAALRANGADDATVFAAREHSFGHDAATRLAELDERRRQWDARLSNYRSERDALVSESNAVDTAQRSAEIDALRAQHFSEPEILRVRMLDDAEARNRN